MFPSGKSSGLRQSCIMVAKTLRNIAREGKLSVSYGSEYKSPFVGQSSLNQ